MRELFQRDMNDKESQIYCKAIDFIKNRNDELIKMIDDSINNRKINLFFEIKFYLNESNLSIDEKISYLIKLKSKILKMQHCDVIKIRVSKPWHPMCWCYWLSKKFTKNEFFKDHIMYGFSVPFYPSKPIMISYYTFENDFNFVKEILAHELTHSVIGTKDLNATNYKDALNDAWTLGYLY